MKATCFSRFFKKSFQYFLKEMCFFELFNYQFKKLNRFLIYKLEQNGGITRRSSGKYGENVQNIHAKLFTTNENNCSQDF